MRTLNLGILAHVDAGKTTLTERLLYLAGVIDEIGSVDTGSTQTDTLELERQRGITIKAAVVSFVVDDVAVNLIDTPGHPDFIAEVERALAVLDAAVLVISAVEGVQPQTRILMRTLQRLGIPTVLFVNKIDRVGARDAALLADIGQRLTPAIVAMGAVGTLGSRDAIFEPYGAGDAPFATPLAEVLALEDDALLAAYIDDPAVPYARLRAALATQTRRAAVHPVYFGSAITGAGAEALLAGIIELLPAAAQDRGGPVSGTVFKVDRGPAGDRIAYVRLFSGTLRTRARVDVRGEERRVTAISVFDRGFAVPRACLVAGEIGKVSGLGDIRIGEPIGAAPARMSSRAQFAPPTLEAVVSPREPRGRGALQAALAQLAEQDPLIDLRQDDLRRELYVSLYGEVQKEVVRDTLALEFGIDVEFEETTTICVERPVGRGAAVEVKKVKPNPFLATVGLRIDPAPPGSGVAYQLAIEVHGTMPAAFFKAIEDTVSETLTQGLHGWQVTDCTVTLTHTGYMPRQSHAHQKFSKAMSSTGWDFRGLTPLVVMSALKEAGTTVCEPIHRFRLEIPSDRLGALLPVLASLRAVPGTPVAHGPAYVIEGTIPAARVHELQLQLPPLTGGEGVLESAFECYQPVVGPVPARSRTDLNPLDRKEYLLHFLRRV